jgi:hypothetical protein
VSSAPQSATATTRRPAAAMPACTMPSTITRGWAIQRSSAMSAKKPPRRSGFAPTRFFTDHGIVVKRVLTDNGCCYRSKDFAKALTPAITRKRPAVSASDQRQSRTIQPQSAAEWAYADTYTSDEARAATYDDWLHHYNYHRATPESAPTHPSNAYAFTTSPGITASSPCAPSRWRSHPRRSLRCAFRPEPSSHVRHRQESVTVFRGDNGPPRPPRQPTSHATPKRRNYVPQNQATDRRRTPAVTPHSSP